MSKGRTNYFYAKHEKLVTKSEKQEKLLTETN